MRRVCQGLNACKLCQPEYAEIDVIDQAGFVRKEITL